MEERKFLNLNKKEAQTQKDKEKERSYRFLTHIPEGIELTTERMKDLAKEYNEILSIKVSAQQGDDGWYVYAPDGKREKIADIIDPKDKPNIYLIYYPNGATAISKQGSFGIEVRHESK